MDLASALTQQQHHIQPMQVLHGKRFGGGLDHSGNRRGCSVWRCADQGQHETVVNFRWIPAISQVGFKGWA